MSVFYAASFLSRPVIYKNGDLAGVCKEVAFSSRLNKMTGLIVYDRDGKRRFLAARHIASQGYDAVILKTGAVLTDPMGSFPLGRLAYRPDGKPLGRMEDAALDEKRNVLFFTLTSGESYPPAAVIKGADPAVIFGQEDAPLYQKRRYARKKSEQSAGFSAAPAEEKEAPLGEAEQDASPNGEISETKNNAAPNGTPATETTTAAVAAAAEIPPAADCGKPSTVPTLSTITATNAEEALPATKNEAEASPAKAPPHPQISADSNRQAQVPKDGTPQAEISTDSTPAQTPADRGSQAQRFADSTTQAQISTDVTAKTGTSRPAAPMLYTLPGAGFALPERVADGRSLLGRVMKADLYARCGTAILRAGERVTPAAVIAAARAGLTVDLVRKSRPVLF